MQKKVCQKRHSITFGQAVLLFNHGEISLRDALRSGFNDEEIYALIQRTLFKKEKEHLPVDILSTKENRPMILIGG
ncbi:unnamed protein product [Rotaria sp. Silwood1]|nr:unnamed protein product [Rotaria sp. Silwood1]